MHVHGTGSECFIERSEHMGLEQVIRIEKDHQAPGAGGEPCVYRRCLTVVVLEDATNAVLIEAGDHVKRVVGGTVIDNDYLRPLILGKRRLDRRSEVTAVVVVGDDN